MDIKTIVHNFLLGQLSNPFVQLVRLESGIEMIVKLLTYLSTWFQSINTRIPPSLLSLTLKKFIANMKQNPLYVSPIKQRITKEFEVNNVTIFKEMGSFYLFSIHDTVVSFLKSDNMALHKLLADKDAIYHSPGN